MKILNGTVFCDDMTLKKAEVFTEGDRISRDSRDGQTLDADGCIVAPGFFDIHIHGAVGHDFCEATRAANDSIAKYLAGVGVTPYLGTTMAMPPELLMAILDCGGKMINEPTENGARMRGIHLEGPFISKEKKGAMTEKFLLAPDYALFTRFMQASGGNIRLCSMAPELEGGMEFVQQASGDCVVSLAHSEADYDTAKKALQSGAGHVTHLFNAMSAFNHRSPGIVGAAMDFASSAELIADGMHVHPAVVRAVFSMFGEERVCLISDAIMACGLPEGEYSLGGMTVAIKNGVAMLGDTIAGAATPITEGFRRAVKEFGVPLIAALKACTVNPAKAVGLFDEIGSITIGKRADFTLLDAETLAVRHCVLGGKLLF